MAHVKITMVLLLAAVLSAVLCQDQKVEEFKLQITENGTKFEETIEVNTEAETEVFKVPAQNRNAKADVMNDFKRRLTVHRIHDVKTCYVSRLQPDEPSPQNLKESLEKVALSNKRLPVTVVSKQWIPVELVSSYLLSKEVLNFCGAYPIYRVEQHSADAVMSIRKTEGGQNQRSKRNISLCKRLDQYHNINCASDEWKFSCKVTSRCGTCRVTCTGDTFELCGGKLVYHNVICCDIFC